MSPDHKQKIAELADHFAAGSDSNYASAHRAGFYAGAQSTLSLLAEPQAGHPPRLWTYKIESTQEMAVFIDGPMCQFRPAGCPEYLSLSEHQALRARDAAEIERLQRACAERCAHQQKLADDVRMVARERDTERQARQAAEARVRKLEEALGKIAASTYGTELCKSDHERIARAALAPLREEE